MIFVNTIGHWNFTLKLKPPPSSTKSKMGKKHFWGIESFVFFCDKESCDIFLRLPLYRMGSLLLSFKNSGRQS